MTDKGINKLRSMLIMEQYFGHQMPNSKSYFIPISNLPKRIQELFKKARKISKKCKENKIHLN